MLGLVRVVIADVSQYEDEWPEGNLAEVIQWLNSKLSEIPAEFHGASDFSIELGYDNDLSIEISYTRPKTQEDVDKETAESERRAKAREDEERARFLELQRKYGASS